MTAGDTASVPRIDPARSACVLIGVDTYESLPDLRSVRRNVEDLDRALGDPGIWGVPDDRRWVVPNPRTPGELTGPIREAVEKAEDTILVYYAGHGLLELDDELHLALPASKHGWGETSLAFSVLRGLLLEARGSVKRRVVVLDCCYSGKALGEMDGEETVPRRRQIEIEGSYVLTSTTERERAHAPLLKTHTAFTGALLDILQQGDPGHGERETLTLNQIYRLLKDSFAIRQPPLPAPQAQDQNGVGDLPFIRNCPRPANHVPIPSRWSRLRLLLAGAGILLTGAGLGVGTTLGWERHASQPRDFPGSCGSQDRAVLLDVSDRLDESGTNEYNGTAIEQLSALALTGEGTEAIAVRDQGGTHVFRLTLGREAPHTLRPEVRHQPRTLYTPEGRDFPKFDGEGLVIERDGRTILVSEERGPSIRRFRLSDGRQLGEPLPLPKVFRPPPAPGGRADGTRNLESLTATPDGKHLFAGMEGPLLGDDGKSGAHRVRIQSYRGESGSHYTPSIQYGYPTDQGYYLTELIAVDDTRLLALERGYMNGLGSGVRVYKVDLDGATNVDGQILDTGHEDRLVDKELLFDLASCPPGDLKKRQGQPNPLMENVEGMALGPPITGTYRGRRALYLVADNNSRPRYQSTRIYSLAVRLP
ncbi:esterase-like activity of phytase family protein [Streptomyces sp. NPDC059256]|uniref:caspase, EACC1-associated type n=1 Tax=Streptomyces sp. NPDC059256 TaxID=3346794 RepID=UPI0036890927